MGMAASQARYLALTARKTNTEYEGQQINQARTALANQSANLFNQLLGLEVPVAPKTTNVYTGSQKLLSNPEVQIAEKKVNENNYKDLKPKVEFNVTDNKYRIEFPDGTFKEFTSISPAEVETNPALKDFVEAKKLATEDGVLNDNVVYGYSDSDGTWHFYT